MIKWDKPCYKCLSHFCDLSCKEPKHLQAPQRTWVGLTEEERESFWKADQMTQKEWDELFTAIESKLKEKNGG